MIEGIFVEGLIFSIMVLGVLISYRILDLADLTCDSSFATGAAVVAISIYSGVSTGLSLVLAFLVGLLCGFVTATIHNKLRIPGLLASILTMTMLYSVNLRILGNKANLPLMGKPTLYRSFPDVFAFLSSSALASLLGTLLIVLFVKVLMDLFFRSDNDGAALAPADETDDFGMAFLSDDDDRFPLFRRAADAPPLGAGRVETNVTRTDWR